MSSASLSPRIFAVNLENEDGLRITVSRAHFHHQPAKCEAQYEQLQKHGSLLHMGEHVVMLGDHNSVIALGLGIEVPTPHDNLPPTATAREMEFVFFVEKALLVMNADLDKLILSPAKLPNSWRCSTMLGRSAHAGCGWSGIHHMTSSA